MDSRLTDLMRNRSTCCSGDTPSGIYNPFVLDSRTFWEWSVVYRVYAALRAFASVCLFGGAIRDVLAEVRPSDYDFAVKVVDVRDRQDEIMKVANAISCALSDCHIWVYERDVTSYGTLADPSAVIGSLEIVVDPIDSTIDTPRVQIDLMISTTASILRADYDVNSLRAAVRAPKMGDSPRSCLAIMNSSEEVLTVTNAVRSLTMRRPPCGKKCLLRDNVQQLRERKMRRRGFTEDVSDYCCENPQCVRAHA